MIVLKFPGHLEPEIMPILGEAAVLKVDMSIAIDTLSPERLDALKALGVKVMVPIEGGLIQN